MRLHDRLGVANHLRVPLGWTFAVRERFRQTERYRRAPRRQATPVESVQAPPTQPIVPGQGTILVVEDNAEVADITASLVEQLGYQTLRAENATDALNRLRRGDKVDLVLSDVVMPGGMNGIALAQEIGNHYAPCGRADQCG